MREDQAQGVRKKERRNAIAIAIGLALAVCFVLGVILCLGLLVKIVVSQANLANKSLSEGSASIQGIEKTVNDFVRNSKKTVDQIEISIYQIVKDLDAITKRVDNLTI